MQTYSLRRLAPALVLGLALVAGACSDDTTPTNPFKTQTYNQVQRLGNPLISEVLLDKRSHPTHGSTGPDQDAALIGPELFSHLVKNSPTTFAGRDSGYVGVLASVLLPDMLIVQTDKDPATASWLNWVGLAPLANGWGGRKLTDDVVDLALLAVFGDPFGADPTHTTPALTTDHVASDSPVTGTFPYLAAPN
ncbi:MAG: DUF4331 family protein [Gemmatimonadales bacterium]